MIRHPNTTPARRGSLRSPLAMPMLILACSLLSTLPAAADTCANKATIGNFEVTFEGAQLDGGDTIFTYCITGLDVPGFRALSNWELSLDPACIGENDLISCEPEPCFHQVDDPNTGITGIKFDDVEVEAGETECFAFALAGDWTGMLGDVTAGLKAATDVSFGDICGPVCENCSAVMQVLSDSNAELLLSTRILHNTPQTVNATVWYKILDGRGRQIHRWSDREFRFTPGSKYRYLGPIPGLPKIAPGRYELVLELEFMHGWHQQAMEFEVE